MIRKAIGSIGVLVIALLAFGMAKATVQHLRQPKAQSAQEVRASAERTILSQSMMMVVLKRDFPKEYDAIMTKLTSLAMSKMSDAELRTASAREMAAVRTRYAPALANAADIDLQVLLRDNKEMHEAVLKHGGPVACDKVFRLGAAGVSADFMKNNKAVVDRVATHTFETLRRAIDDPRPKPAPATEADWVAVVEHMQAAGVTEAELMKMSEAENDPNAKDLCPTGIAMFEALLSMQGEGGHRLRSEFVTTLVATM